MPRSVSDNADTRHVRRQKISRSPEWANRSPRRIPLAYRAQSWAHLFDLRCTDVFITFCSIWVAIQLWIWPGEFSSEFTAYSQAIHVRGNERVWALFCGIAALLKFAGLASRNSKRPSLGDGLLTAGLFMSLVFWGILGTSSLMDTPHRVTTIVVFALAIAAAWQIVQPHNPPERTK